MKSGHSVVVLLAIGAGLVTAGLRIGRPAVG